MLFRRSIAYKQCFLGENGELTPAAKVVLADLTKFASFGEPTIVSPVSRQTDIPATMQRIGRGDVVQRVWRYLRLPTSKLFELNGDDQ